MHIYTADSEVIRGNSTLEELLTKLPEEMHAKAYRYRFERDAFNFALGRLLLKKGLAEIEKAHLLSQITFQENDKPVLEGVYFNISHSADRVVCVVSESGQVGIDIEKYKVLPLDDFRRSFTQKEWFDIQNAPEPMKTFFWYWTRKESVIKALGVNLSYLHKIELDPTKEFFIIEGKKWCLQDLDFSDGYMGALCSEESGKCIVRKYDGHVPV